MYKPLDMYVQDTGSDQYFTGKLQTSYDGCSGKCGVYVPSNGEIV